MFRGLAFSNVTDLLRQDEARVAAFKEYSTHGRRASVPLSNAHWGYTVSVGIGYPTTIYNLIVDSASAITWVGASTSYVSSTGINTGKPVAFDYGYGSFKGTIFKDMVTFGIGLSIPSMQIGVASTSQGFGFDGVLGIGPRGLSRGTLQNSPEAKFPTVTDYLFLEDTIPAPVVGIFFQPTNTDLAPHGQGEISFGGANPYRHTTNIVYTDITATPGSSRYWGINQMITYGYTDILDDTAGVVDCGCTFLYIASDAYERYRVVTGGTVNTANGLIQISLDQYYNLHNLDFHIGENTYRLIPNAQIWPRSLNYILGGGGGDNNIFLIVKSLAEPTGSGLDFINGYVFLQRFYTVFDSDRRKVGFAQTTFTYANSN